MITITGKENTANVRLIMLRSALRMEVRGMRMTRKGSSAYSIIKKEFGFKGNKQKVLDQFNAYLEKELGV